MEGEFPEDLKCPVCFEVPEKEIYQCKNGHTICDECSEDMSLCPQCRVEMGGDGKIRSRALENLLDMMKFDCSYKTNGCTEKTSRKDITSHFDSCSFGGERILFCKHLGYDCNFQVIKNQSENLLGHLRDSHQIAVHDGNTIKIKMKRLTKADPNMKILWTPIIATLNKKQLIILAYTKDNAVSFTTICIDDEDCDNYRIEYNIESNSDKGSNLEWTTKLIPYSKSESIIKNPPLSIPFDLLRDTYLENDHLTVRAFILTQNNLIETEPSDSYHHTMRTELNIPLQNRVKKQPLPTLPVTVETPPDIANVPETLNIAPSPQLPPHSLTFRPGALMANLPHSSRKHRHRHHRKSRDHNVAKLLNPMATMSTSSGESCQPINCHKVWTSIACDSCKVRPLAGARYKCLQCRNYDLCGSCMSLNVHPHHFVLITCDAQNDAIIQKIRDGHLTRKAYIERLKIPETEADPSVLLESTFQPQLTRCSKCPNNADFICLQCSLTQNKKYCSECFARDPSTLHNANHLYAVTRTQRARKFVLAILLLEGLA